MRQIKIFLGACINVSQAQCLNCRALARHLDKSKFIVGARSFSNGDLPIEKLPGVKYFHVRFPAHFWWRIQFVRGLLWCDVAYLPTADHWKWANWVLKFAGKRSFRTIEGVLDGIAYERSRRCFGSREEICRFYESTDRTYAITRYMIDRNRETVGLHEPNGVLYLGTDFDEFSAEKKASALTDVILIGADLERKGLSDYLFLARRFHDLRFHVVGGGVAGSARYASQCAEQGLSNVIFHGQMSHDQIKDLLRGVQLHVFPSRAEGFPKVTLETAAAGVPSVVYSDYGAEEWITSGKDGFVVKTVDDMAHVMTMLLAHPEKLQPLVDNARLLARRFDWGERVKDWEQEIISLANDRKSK